jgi:hypothetical protein
LSVANGALINIKRKWCLVLCQKKVYGHFFLEEANVTDLAFPDMLEEWLYPQIRKDLAAP